MSALLRKGAVLVVAGMGHRDARLVEQRRPFEEAPVDVLLVGRRRVDLQQEGPRGSATWRAWARSTP